MFGRYESATSHPLILSLGVIPPTVKLQGFKLVLAFGKTIEMLIGRIAADGQTVVQRCDRLPSRIVGRSAVLRCLTKKQYCRESGQRLT